MINEGLLPRRLKTPIFDRITKAKPQPKVSPTFHRIMKEVVPPLRQEDFLDKWQEDRKELDKVRKENTKLKSIMNTTWSKDWRNKIKDEEKKT